MGWSPAAVVAWAAFMVGQFFVQNGITTLHLPDAFHWAAMCLFIGLACLASAVAFPPGGHHR